MDPNGKAGPHPDLHPSILEWLLTEDEVGRAAGDPQVTILQQRTFPDLPHPRGSRRFALTTGLALVRRPEQAALLLVEGAREAGDAEWRIVGAVTVGLDQSPGHPPYTAALSVVPRTAVSVGMYVADPRAVGGLRVELADGTVVEDAVDGRSAHLVALLGGPEAWARDAMLHLLAPDGHSIAVQPVAVHPNRPPGVEPPAHPG